MKSTAPIPDLAEEHSFFLKGYRKIAGVDEVGYSSIAGPIIVTAVILPLGESEAGLDQTLTWLTRTLSEVRDSKRLGESKRERLYNLICGTVKPVIGIGRVDAQEIDQAKNPKLGIDLATSRAIVALPIKPDFILLDGGLVLEDSPAIAKYKEIAGGDGKCLSIAVASIVAKVVCDKIMCELGQHYQSYGFERHKGYPTPEHLTALRRFGPIPAVHRYKHKFVKEVITNFNP